MRESVKAYNRVLESEHPYASPTSSSSEVTFEGAGYVYVTFDPRSRLDDGELRACGDHALYCT